MQSDLEMLRRTTANLAEVLGFVDPGALDRPTPCTDWCVRDLVEHVTGGNRFTLYVIDGMAAQDAIAAVHAAFEHDRDPLVAAGASAQAQFRAFHSCDLSHAYDHVVGELTGEQMLRLRIHDLGIHVWDLLQGVKPEKGLDPVYVRWAIDELAGPDSLTARHFATGYSQPRSPFELLHAFGRRRSHRPGHVR